MVRASISENHHAFCAIFYSEMSKQIYKFLNFLDTRDHFVYEGTEQENVTVLILVNYQIL